MEEGFLRSGAHNAITVREATKALLPALTPEALRVLRGMAPAAGGAGSAALALGAPLAATDRFTDALVEMRKLTGLRMEAGDAAKTADERSLRIQDRIERAEHKVAVMKEALTAARLARQREAALVASTSVRIAAELGEVRTKGAENEATLAAFTSQQTTALGAAHGTKDGELRADVARIHAEFAKLAEANETAASTLRKKRNHLRVEYSRVLADYDRDLLEVTEKIERIKDMMAREKAQLDILRAHFALVDMNARAVAEELEFRKRTHDVDVAKAALRRMGAARRLQRWYRAILEMRAAEKKKSKKAGGKKKGKK